MRVVAFEELGRAAWDSSCGESPEAWFWHSSAWLEYSLAYAAERGARSHAFAVVDGDRVLAICPVASEDVDGGRELLYGGGPCPAPALAERLTTRERGGVLDLIVARVDAIAAAEAARRWIVKRTPLSRSAVAIGIDPLTHRGFIDVSLSTRVVELRGRGEAALWRDVRHGHRYDIRRGEKALDVVVVDREHFQPAIFEGYVDLHRRAAGRVTRPRRTFDLMAEWITEDRAALFVASDAGRMVSAAYVIVHSGSAFYASAANDPEWTGIPGGHLLQWRILRWLLQRGTLRYELGLQTDAVLLHAGTTDKERAIARFKRGFGGLTVPLVLLERYYSEPLFRQEMDRRVERYARVWLSGAGQTGEDPAGEG